MNIPERVRFLQETLANLETLVDVMRRHLDYLGGDIHRAEENGPSVFDPDADPTSENDGGGGE